MKSLKLCGPFLANIRRQKDIKAAPLARRIGVSESTLSRIETGKTRLSLDLCELLCQELQFPIDRLFEQVLQWGQFRQEWAPAPIAHESFFSHSGPTYELDAVLNGKQAAEFMKVSMRTLARRVKDGKLAIIRVERAVRFRFRAIMEYLLKHELL